MIILIFDEYVCGIFHPMRWVLEYILFHRRENWNWEKLRHLSQVAQISEVAQISGEMELELWQSDASTCTLDTASEYFVHVELSLNRQCNS